MLVLEVLRTILTDDDNTRLGESSHLLRRDVLRRDNDSDTGPDLVAHAGVPLGDLAGARDHHVDTLDATQLARGRKLGVAPLELAVQLAPTNFTEHLPDLRRLRKPHCDEVAAIDLESHAAESLEVRAKLGPLLERERKERSIGSERIGERDDLCRLELVRAKPLDDPGGHRHGTDDLLGLAPTQRETLEPVVSLIGGHVTCERGDADAPGRYVDVELVAQRRDSREERRRLVVTTKMRMDRAIRAELAETPHAVGRAGVLEQRDELVTETRGRQIADEPHLDAATEQAHGVLIEAEPIARLVADAPENACRGPR